MAPLHRVSMLKGSFGLLLLLGLAACGGGGDTGAGGGGGCGGGATVAGIVLCADSVAPKYNGTLTPSVDIVQGICTDGTPEPYFEHQATVTISARLATGATIPPVSPTVTITRYVIDYTANPGVVGPTIRSTGDIFDTITVAVGGSTSRDVQLMGINQKSQFLFDLGGAGAFDGSFRRYAVTYTFYGQDQFGNNLTARGFGQVEIGNFQNCAT